jgi:thiamine-phosphate pyrophosphorylase
MKDILQLATTIAQQHPQLQIGSPLACETYVSELNTHASPVYQSAWLAARSLGFIVKDAASIANAWQAQTTRLGSIDPLSWPIDAKDFGLDNPKPDQQFPACPSKLGLYAVVPDAQWVDRLVQLGVPTVQLRFKSDDAKAVRDQIQSAVQAVQHTATLLFINDHWQLAIDAGAYGVHLGQEDMQEASLKQLHASGLRLGLSTHGYREMQDALAWQPSYLALGAVFPTTLKRMETAPQGLGRLEKYVRLVHPLPTVAIGGIDLASLPAVMQTGVGSAAVVRAITAADDVSVAVAALKKCIADNRI